jgi:hypothetical protein
VFDVLEVVGVVDVVAPPGAMTAMAKDVRRDSERGGDGGSGGCGGVGGRRGKGMDDQGPCHHAASESVCDAGGAEGASGIAGVAGVEGVAGDVWGGLTDQRRQRASGIATEGGNASRTASATGSVEMGNEATLTAPGAPSGRMTPASTACPPRRKDAFDDTTLRGEFSDDDPGVSADVAGAQSVRDPHVTAALGAAGANPANPTIPAVSATSAVPVVPVVSVVPAVPAVPAIPAFPATAAHARARGRSMLRSNSCSSSRRRGFPAGEHVTRASHLRPIKALRRTSADKF